MDFLPVDILAEFKNLNGFVFSVCDIPNIRSNIFTVEFQRVEYLNFENSNVQSIEEKAFEQLINLKWISFDRNKIKTLPLLVFKHNIKLIYVDFQSNWINSVNPYVFKELKELIYVKFRGNQCADDDFGDICCSLDHSVLNLGLSMCFTNCLQECFVDASKILDPFKNDTQANPSTNLEVVENSFSEEILQMAEQLRVLELKMEKVKREITEMNGRLDHQARKTEAHETALSHALELKFSHQFDEIISKKLETFRSDIMSEDPDRS
jgi:5-hydroxyisourate hydrolase-like protein (transthyretin family)